MTRRRLTSLQRAAIFQANQGICYLCEQKIQVGQRWDIEHMIPLALGGPDTESNMLVAHKSCHAGKTKTDLGTIAKVKRVRAKHVGAKRSTAFKKPDGYEWDWKRRRLVKEAR